MKIYRSITFKLFIVLSMVLTFFMFFIFFVQVFVIGRSYTISQFTLEKERQLAPLLDEFRYKSTIPKYRDSRYFNDRTFLNNMETFENVNNVNLIILDCESGTEYLTTKTKNELSPSYINYIITNAGGFSFNKPASYASSFRVYNRFGIPTKYVVFVTQNTIQDRQCNIITVIPEVFTSRTSNLLKGYVAYIFTFLLALIFAVSAIFSYIVTKPVLKINRTASKIANLNFSQKCEVYSKDEIGSLAATINDMSASLENTIKNLYDANNKLHKDLDLQKELDSLRREFIGAVTHEFKTPITLIRGYTESIKDNVAADGEEREKVLDVIIRETEKMDKLVRDLLDLSKLESVGYVLNESDFYIDKLLSDTANKYDEVMKERSINFYSVFKCSGILVKGDSFRIEQVVSNFISNAIENTPPDKNIILSSENKGNFIVVSIVNQGKSIDKKELNRIWEKFYRIEKSRNKKFGGTGLGLAISKSILNLHKSRFGAENTSDGVRFYFTLNKSI